MRKVISGIYYEDQYPGLSLGLIETGNGLLLIDAPPRVEDGREWLAAVMELGQPEYLALLDSHPDRTLGARIFTLRRIAQQQTLQTIDGWSDTYKGSANPIGGEVDQFKRITGVRKSMPEISFTEQLELFLGDRRIHFWHQPGPASGSMWVVLPKEKVVFIGDTVTVKEPPYVGQADIDAWLESLDVLRDDDMKGYRRLSGREGRIKRDDINAMARFLRKIPVRLERMAEGDDREAEADKIARELMDDFSVSSARQELAYLRLKYGLINLFNRIYPDDE
jgi:glyoxylase-like metal-dependent hydrolase (beta-lactamase superfamily II)